MKFDLPKDQASIIKVIGVGGGGSNAVNHMYNQGITGVDFVICNTDAQALELSPIPNKIQLGTTLTEGLGAGANPEVGKNAALEDLENIKAILEKNTKMVFITAGMGGGTGSGAAPVIAEVAKELGILTVGIVTIPFSFEGRRRKSQADEGLEALRQQVDTLLVINNDKLRMLHGNLRMSEAFSKADDILTIAAKGIAEIITVAGYINVDFEDVKTVMKDGGRAIMGSGIANGENRAIEAVTKALSSPLLNDNEIKGANFILLNITSGDQEITMDEIDEITDFIQSETGYTAELIWGNGNDETLGESISVTVIATGFGESTVSHTEAGRASQKIVHDLDKEVSTVITQAVDDDTVATTSSDETTVATEEQAAFSFSAPEPEAPAVSDSVEQENKVEDEVAPEQKVVFSLDDNEQDIVNKREEALDAIEEEAKEVFEALDKEETYVSETIESNQTPTANLDTPSNDNNEEVKETIVWNLEDDVDANTVTSSSDVEPSKEESPVYTNRIPDEDQLERSQQRIMKIKELGIKMRTPSGISDLEKEPAYKRRNINLDDVPHSSENNVSRYTLSDDEEGKPRLKDDNSFLHDNVD